MNRKEIKTAGRKSFHKHYLVLMFSCIVLALFGMEAGRSVRLLKIQIETQTQEGAKTVLHANDVFTSIVEGDLKLGEAMSEKLKENIPSNLGGNKALGTTDGIIAGFINSAMSGKIYVSIADAIYKITKSEKATGIIFIILDLLLYLIIWFFIRNVLSVVVRRLFLEARKYEKVPLLNMLHFIFVRKWVQACYTMFLKIFFMILWSFTIIGGFIKRYSYYLVPYIVAENPDFKGTQAITLSRKMMQGHKLEAFKLDLSFIGWYLLSFITIGVSDAVYGFPYRTAARAEYYAYLRELAKQNGLSGAEALDDTYLYEKADKLTLQESYSDVVEMQTIVREKEMKLSRVRLFIIKWFSLWLGRLDDKKKYDEIESYKIRIGKSIKSMEGITYPLRLKPRWKERKKLLKNVNYMRSYSIWTLIIMFILFCFIGWCWEVLLNLIRNGYFANRGVMHGPWLPIYGSGGLIVLIICSRFRKIPVLELIVSVALCGVVEYYGAYYLENKYHQRWWSYDGCFLNIDGRVCAEGLIVFGICCMIVVYLAAPIFDYYLTKLRKKVLYVLAVGLLTLFIIDGVYSRYHPNMAKGAIEQSDAYESSASGGGP